MDLPCRFYDANLVNEMIDEWREREGLPPKTHLPVFDLDKPDTENEMETNEEGKEDIGDDEDDDDDDEESIEAEPEPEPEPEKQKRGRGRPRKDKSSDQSDGSPASKRPVGRPCKPDAQLKNHRRYRAGNLPEGEEGYTNGTKEHPSKQQGPERYDALLHAKAANKSQGNGGQAAQYEADPDARLGLGTSASEYVAANAGIHHRQDSPGPLHRLTRDDQNNPKSPGPLVMPENGASQSPMDSGHGEAAQSLDEDIVMDSVPRASSLENGDSDAGSLGNHNSGNGSSSGSTGGWAGGSWNESPQQQQQEWQTGHLPQDVNTASNVAQAAATQKRKQQDSPEDFHQTKRRRLSPAQEGRERTASQSQSPHTSNGQQMQTQTQPQTSYDMEMTRLNEKNQMLQQMIQENYVHIREFTRAGMGSSAHVESVKQKNKDMQAEIQANFQRMSEL